MRLDVAFVPTLRTPIPDPPSSARPRRPARNRQLCIVVDVIRASTSLITLVERGASRVFIAGDIDTARAAAPRTGAVLAGEQDGLAPPGFTYGNSPVELSRASVAGRSVVFVTTNGTAAIRAVVTDAPTVLVGALRNGAAVCREAWQEATAHGSDITIVCAGREHAFAIDDAYCAGFLIHRIRESGSGDLTDAAMAAVALFRGEPDAQAVLTRSAAGRNVIRLGLADDITYCAQRDASSVVPRLGRELFLLETL